MNRFSPLLISLALAALSPGAAAQVYARGAAMSAENIRYGFADVLRVDPVFEQVRDSRPREQCFDEEVTRVEPGGGDPTGGTVVGAIVGGALGNTVGKGDGRRAATIAGAVIGGAVGRNAVQNNRGQPREYGEVRTRCRVVEDLAQRRELVGYDVEYRYRGDVFMSRLDYDPGSRLRVRVGVTPSR
ncbi:MAG: glycine zipper 2TM domain-containing protein [Lysobacterales bacterium]